MLKRMYKKMVALALALVLVAGPMGSMKVSAATSNQGKQLSGSTFSMVRTSFTNSFQIALEICDSSGEGVGFVNYYYNASTNKDSVIAYGYECAAQATVRQFASSSWGNIQYSEVGSKMDHVEIKITHNKSTVTRVAYGVVLGLNYGTLTYTIESMNNYE